MPAELPGRDTCVHTCIEAGARRDVVRHVQVRQRARGKQRHLLTGVLQPALRRRVRHQISSFQMSHEQCCEGGRPVAAHRHRQHDASADASGGI